MKNHSIITAFITFTLFVLIACRSTSLGAEITFQRLDENGNLQSQSNEISPKRWILCHSRSSSADGSVERELKDMMMATYHAERDSGSGATGFVWISCDQDDAMMLQGLREYPVPFLLVSKSAKGGHAFARIGEINEIPAVVVVDVTLQPTKTLNGLAAIKSVFGLPEAETPPSPIFKSDLSLETWLSGSDRYEGYTLVTNALAWAWGVESGIPQMGFCESEKFPSRLSTDPSTKLKFKLLADAAQTQNNLLNARLIQSERSDRHDLIGKLMGTGKAPTTAKTRPGPSSRNEFSLKRSSEQALLNYETFVASLTSPVNHVFRSAVLLRLKDYDFDSNRFPCEAEHRVFVVNELRYLRPANTLFDRPSHPIEMGRLPAGNLFASTWPQTQSGFEADYLRPGRDIYSGAASISLPPDAAERLLSSFADSSNRVVLALVEGGIRFDRNGEATFMIERGRVAGSVVFAGGGRNPVPVGLDLTGKINGVAIEWKQ